MDDRKLVCQLCQKRVANTSNVLARHIRSVHGTEWDDYIVRFDHGGVWPTCACGCNERLAWKKGGFGKYVKGHDNKGLQNSKVKVTIKGPGWVPNPFTGCEEYIALEDEIAFLEQCIESGDQVTHDHSIRVGWMDVTGKPRVLVPSFKHLQKRLIFVIDSPKSHGFDQRMAGLREWCDHSHFMLLVVRRDADGFFVVGAHRGKGLKDAEKKGIDEGSKPD